MRDIVCYVQGSDVEKILNAADGDQSGAFNLFEIHILYICIEAVETEVCGVQTLGREAGSIKNRYCHRNPSDPRCLLHPAA